MSTVDRYGDRCMHDVGSGSVLSRDGADLLWIKLSDQQVLTLNSHGEGARQLILPLCCSMVQVGTVFCGTVCTGCRLDRRAASLYCHWIGKLVDVVSPHLASSS